MKVKLYLTILITIIFSISKATTKFEKELYKKLTEANSLSLESIIADLIKTKRTNSWRLSYNAIMADKKTLTNYLERYTKEIKKNCHEQNSPCHLTIKNLNYVHANIEETYNNYKNNKSALNALKWSLLHYGLISDYQVFNEQYIKVVKTCKTTECHKKKNSIVKLKRLTAKVLDMVNLKITKKRLTPKKLNALYKQVTAYES